MPSDQKHAGAAPDTSISAGDTVCNEQPLKNIRAPHSHDVLCGRGGGTNNHPGNENFRDLVNNKKVQYLHSSKREKPLVSRSIVEAVRNQSPPGRFLQKNDKTGLWDDIGDQKAREKTSQALREGAPVIRREISVGGPAAGARVATGGAATAIVAGGPSPIKPGYARNTSEASAPMAASLGQGRGHHHVQPPPSGQQSGHRVGAYHPAPAGVDQLQMERHMRNVAMAEMAIRDNNAAARALRGEGWAEPPPVSPRSGGRSGSVDTSSGCGAVTSTSSSGGQTSGTSAGSIGVATTPDEIMLRQQVSGLPPSDQDPIVRQRFVMQMREQVQVANRMRQHKFDALRQQQLLTVGDPQSPQAMVGLSQPPPYQTPQQVAAATQMGILSPSGAPIGMAPMQPHLSSLGPVDATDPAMAQWLAAGGARQHPSQHLLGSTTAIDQNLAQGQAASLLGGGGAASPPTPAEAFTKQHGDRSNLPEPEKDQGPSSNSAGGSSPDEEDVLPAPNMSEDMKQRLIQAEWTARSVADGTATEELLAADKDAALYHDAGLLGIDPDEMTEHLASGCTVQDVVKQYYKKMNELPDRRDDGDSLADLSQSPLNNSNRKAGVAEDAERASGAFEESEIGPMDVDEPVDASKSTAGLMPGGKSVDMDVVQPEKRGVPGQADRKTEPVNDNGETGNSSGKKRNRTPGKFVSTEKCELHGSTVVNIFDSYLAATTTCKRVEAALQCIGAM